MSGKIIGLLAVVLGALAAMGIGLVTAQNSGVEVRVEARRLADGRIEFAVAQRVDGEWSERILPSSRYFPTNSEGRWLRSSPVTVGQHKHGVGKSKRVCVWPQSGQKIVVLCVDAT